jgi:hypothetical protein
MKVDYRRRAPDRRCVRAAGAYSRSRTPGPPLLPRSINITPASSSIRKSAATDLRMPDGNCYRSNLDPGGVRILFLDGRERGSRRFSSIKRPSASSGSSRWTYRARLVLDCLEPVQDIFPCAACGAAGCLPNGIQGFILRGAALGPGARGYAQHCARSRTNLRR